MKHRIDEVKDIADQAAAMALYAKQAKDGMLIGFATEIKKRAERKAGQLLKQMAESGERATQGTGRPVEQNQEDNNVSRHATLNDIGITRSQSSRFQALADQDEDEFEATVKAAADRAERAVEGTAADRTAEKQRARDELVATLGTKQAALTRSGNSRPVRRRVCIAGVS